MKVPSSVNKDAVESGLSPEGSPGSKIVWKVDCFSSDLKCCLCIVSTLEFHVASKPLSQWATT